MALRGGVPGLPVENVFHANIIPQMHDGCMVRSRGAVARTPTVGVSNSDLHATLSTRNSEEPSFRAPRIIAKLVVKSVALALKLVWKNVEPALKLVRKNVILLSELSKESVKWSGKSTKAS